MLPHGKLFTNTEHLCKDKAACRHINPDSHPSAALVWWKMIICATDVPAPVSPALLGTAAPPEPPSAHQVPPERLGATPASPHSRDLQLWASAGNSRRGRSGSSLSALTQGALAQLLTPAPLSERLLQRPQSTEPARRPRKAQSQRSRFQRRKLKTPVICAGTQEACSRTSSLLVRSLIINSLSFLIAIHFGTSLIYSPKQLCPL